MEAILFALSIAFLVAVAVALGFAAIVYLRLRSPHSAALAKEKAQLEKKLGKEIPASTVKELPATKEEEPKPKWWRQTIGAHWPSALLVVTGVILALWFSNNPLRLEDIGRWGANHWPLVIIGAVVTASLIAFNEKVFGKAAVLLRWLVGATALLMMFSMPLMDWYNSPPAPRVSRPASVPAPAAPYRKPMSGTLSMPPNGDSEPLRVPSGCAATYIGVKFKIHCVYTDGREGIVGDPIHPCVDGPMVHSYVRDESGRPNTVTYEFVCR